MDKPLQLSDSLPESVQDIVLRNATIEQAIDSNPYIVDSLRESGQLKLATGAQMYLREVLVEWMEFERFVREEQQKGQL